MNLVESLFLVLLTKPELFTVPLLSISHDFRFIHSLSTSAPSAYLATTPGFGLIFVWIVARFVRDRAPKGLVPSGLFRRQFCSCLLHSTTKSLTLPRANE